MYLLDTSAVSLFDPRRRKEARRFIDWVDRNDSLLYLSAISLTEIEAGILKLIREDKRQRASQLIDFRDGLIARYADRLLPVDIDVALATARLAEAIRPMVLELPDLLIAATARVHTLIVVTHNLRHFAPIGSQVIDPLSGDLP